MEMQSIFAIEDNYATAKLIATNQLSDKYLQFPNMVIFDARD